MMLKTSALALLSFTAVVSAHYRIQYPEPRGTYESEAQLTFCGKYNRIPVHSIY